MIHTTIRSRCSLSNVLGMFLLALIARSTAGSAINVRFLQDQSGPVGAINFTDQTPFTGPAVVGSAGDYWNAIGGSIFDSTTIRTAIPLQDVTGNSTAVSMSLWSGPFYGKADHVPAVSGQNDTRTWAFDGTPYARLMNQYAFTTVNGFFARFYLTDLTPGPYDLYLYSSPSPDAADRITQFTTLTQGGGTIVDVGPEGDATTFVAGVNYIHLQETVGDDGQLKVLWQPDVSEPGGRSEGDFNGFQLIASPEPGSLSLLAIGSAGLLLRCRTR